MSGDLEKPRGATTPSTTDLSRDILWQCVDLKDDECNSGSRLAAGANNRDLKV